MQAEPRLGVQINGYTYILKSLDNGNIEEVLTADVFFSLGKLSDISHIHVDVVVLH